MKERTARAILDSDKHKTHHQRRQCTTLQERMGGYQSLLTQELHSQLNQTPSHCQPDQAMFDSRVELTQCKDEHCW
jgi:hypothetical protein